VMLTVGCDTRATPVIRLIRWLWQGIQWAVIWYDTAMINNQRYDGYSGLWQWIWQWAVDSGMGTVVDHGCNSVIWIPAVICDTQAMAMDTVGCGNRGYGGL
jgi:hypothetical protein